MKNIKHDKNTDTLFTNKLKHKMNKITVTIVNYNSRKYLYKLVFSLNKIDDLIKEIIIIDNQSDKKNKPDITKLKKIYKQSKKIILKINKANLGFSKAVNQGIIRSKTEYILLLNPDTIILDNISIKNLLDKIERNPKISIIGGKIINEKKECQLSATGPVNFLTGLFEFTNLKKIFPNNRFSRDFWLKNVDTNSCCNVTSLCGAFLLFRKIINNKINYFDEAFFLYLEDVDFGIKNTVFGNRVVYYPKSMILHYGGKSSTGKYNIDLHNWYKSRRTLFKKYLSKLQYITLSIIFSTEEILLRLYHFLKNESAY